MSVLAWKNRTRITVLGLLVVLLAAATVVVGGRQSAQAFDCAKGGKKPIACPFIKITQDNAPYGASADLVDASGNVLYHWSESEEDFTLWQWRWYGANDHIDLTISGRDTITFPASESHCYAVKRTGAYEFTTGCKAG